MTASFKTISIGFDNSDERQVYVVADHVSEEQIRSGDDEGVVCLMVDVAKGEMIATLLSREQGHV